MVLDRPQDIVIMIGIISMVVITAGIGIVQIAPTQDTGQLFGYVGNVTMVNNSLGFNQIGRDSSSFLQQEDKEEESGLGINNFIVSGFSALKEMGRSFAIFRDLLQAAEEDLFIPTEIIAILITMIVVSFAVVLYTWVRGS